jgi:hypothetical protein
MGMTSAERHDGSHGKFHRHFPDARIGKMGTSDPFFAGLTLAQHSSFGKGGLGGVEAIRIPNMPATTVSFAGIPKINRSNRLRRKAGCDRGCRAVRHWLQDRDRRHELRNFLKSYPPETRSLLSDRRRSSRPRRGIDEQGLSKGGNFRGDRVISQTFDAANRVRFKLLWLPTITTRFAERECGNRLGSSEGIPFQEHFLERTMDGSGPNATRLLICVTWPDPDVRETFDVTHVGRMAFSNGITCGANDTAVHDAS